MLVSSNLLTMPDMRPQWPRPRRHMMTSRHTAGNIHTRRSLQRPWHCQLSPGSWLRSLDILRNTESRRLHINFSYLHSLCNRHCCLRQSDQSWWQWYSCMTSCQLTHGAMSNKLCSWSQTNKGQNRLTSLVCWERSSGFPYFWYSDQSIHNSLQRKRTTKWNYEPIPHSPPPNTQKI